VSVTDLGVIYASALSTATAILGVTRWRRGRVCEVNFSYGWTWQQAVRPSLVVRVHNASPVRTVHVIQVGWRDDDGNGSWWDADDHSVPVEAGGTFARTFSIGRCASSIRGTVLLGDQVERVGRPFNVPDWLRSSPASPRASPRAAPTAERPDIIGPF
jgi:hypothetical protein